MDNHIKFTIVCHGEQIALYDFHYVARRPGSSVLPCSIVRCIDSAGGGLPIKVIEFGCAGWKTSFQWDYNPVWFKRLGVVKRSTE
jgi:hypothetical protein